jgi:multicomponent Na+:H+ antiporter subunit D
VPLHVWLPLAHPIAPTPASAVFSGALINAGLLGWLRFLPLGFSGYATLGTTLAVLGLTAALYAAGVGLLQRDPKIILAYSSVSQMGFMTTAVGVGLALPALAGPAKAVAMFYALHHALAKGSLFLGTAVAKATRGSGWPRALVTAGLLWPALELAGAPLSSGALAKISLKSVVAEAHWQWLTSALPLAAVASTLVVLHFFSLARPRRGAAVAATPAAGLWVPWLALLVVDSLFLLVPPVDSAELHLLIRRDKLWSAGWPVLVGALLSAAAWRWRRRRGRDVFAGVPAGDVLVLGVAGARWARAHLQRITRRIGRLDTVKARLLAAATNRARGTLARVERFEARLRGFGAVGMLVLLLVTILVAMLLPHLGRGAGNTSGRSAAAATRQQGRQTPVVIH